MEKPNQLLKRLLEAGVHFGHQTRRWDPRMKNFIFGERNGIHIIDLEKTSGCIDVACQFVKELTQNNGAILFVGTKRQAKETIKTEANRCGMFYVNERWLGGTLTNFQTVRKSVDRYKEIGEMFEDGTVNLLSKKELSHLEKEYGKLKRNLEGIAAMEKYPQALFVIDSKKEHIAIREAKRLHIPIIAMVDTNANPNDVDIPIPSNDDAIRAIKLMTSMIADSIVEAQEQAGIAVPEKKEDAPATEATAEKPAEETPAPAETPETTEATGEKTTDTSDKK